MISFEVYIGGDCKNRAMVIIPPSFALDGRSNIFTILDVVIQISEGKIHDGMYLPPNSPSVSLGDIVKIGPLMFEMTEIGWMFLNGEANKIDGFMNEIKDLYEKQGKIPAIKKWREITNAGLKEAKDKVEEAAKNNGWRDGWQPVKIPVTLSNPSAHDVW